MSGDTTHTEPPPTIEYVAAAPWIGLTGPREDLTERFVAAGHVVERAPRSEDAVALHLAPSHRDVYPSLGWAASGPTAPRRQVRIRWDDPEAREAAIEAAEHPVKYTADVALPDDPVPVAGGEGWRAVSPAEVVVENAILRRAAAERYGYEILRPVPPAIEYAEEYDLVEVNREPVPYTERRRQAPGPTN